jgi:hypothetical protein
MRTFTVDKNNDLVIKSGRLGISTDLLATKQVCEQAVKAILGEMVLNVDEGMPNFETIWQGNPNVAQFEAFVRSRILEVDGVIDIISLSSDLINDKLVYNAEIKTVYGVVNV